MDSVTPPVLRFTRFCSRFERPGALASLSSCVRSSAIVSGLSLSISLPLFDVDWCQ